MTGSAMFQFRDYRTDGLGIQDRFEAFHGANPWVYVRLVQLLEEAKSDGARRIGIKHLFEVLRWQHRRLTRSDDGWKLNNDFSSRYARLIREERPDLGGLLEVRKLREVEA